MLECKIMMYFLPSPPPPTPSFFSFQQNLAVYQNLVTQSMYDKQLDSGKGTLLHLCDDVIQQEVSLASTIFMGLDNC